MPSPTSPGWFVCRQMYGCEPFVPTCMASDPTPSRLVGKRRSVTVNPKISTFETWIDVCGTILVNE
jgi:hypothetical protein